MGWSFLEKALRGDKKPRGGAFGFLNDVRRFGAEAFVEDAVPKVAKGTRDIAVAGGRQLAKFPEGAVRSTAEPFVGRETARGKPPGDPVRRLLYGSEPVETFQERAEGQKKVVGESRFRDATNNPFLTPLLLAGTVAMDSPFGTPLKAGAKGLSGLAKATSPETVLKILPDLTPDKARAIAETGDENIIKNILNKESPAPSPSLADVTVPAPVKPKGAGKGTPQLPTKESAFAKAIVSNSGIISRQGEGGKQLAEGLSKVRDVKELTSANITRAIPTVLKLDNKKFEEFIDTVEGKTDSLDPAIQQAVQEWRTIAPKIRESAVKSGIDVGDLGPNYFPHRHDYDKIFGDQDTYARTINHMIDTGQAKNEADALKQLRFASENQKVNSFGNLEKSRALNLPDYEKNKDALLSYIEGASRRIGEASVFGAKNEKAYDLLGKISAEGHDVESAQKAFEQSIGLTKYSETNKKFSGGLRHLQSLTKLGLGAVTNSTQSINTAILAGYGKTMTGIAKNFTKEGREFSDKAAVVSDAIIRDLKEQVGFTGKVLSKITAPGFGAVEKFNRRVAALAGREYANSLAKKGNIKALQELGVTGEIGRVLTEAQQIQAARKVVEKTQFKTDAMDLPHWANTPYGKVVAQFRTFSYKQSGFVNNLILKPLSQGNALPLIRLLAAVPIGYGIAQGRDVLTNKQDVNKDNVAREILNAWQKVGGGGLLADIPAGFIPREGKNLPSAITQSRIVGTALGPTASSLYELTQNVPRAIQGSPQSLERLGLRSIPVVGPRVANTVFPYTGLEDSQDKIISRLKKEGAAEPQIKAYKSFFLAGRNLSKAKTSASEKVNEALANGDMEQAQQVANEYNSKLYDAYADWNKQYGQYVTDDLQNRFNDKKIVLNKASVRSRLRSLQEATMPLTR